MNNVIKIDNHQHVIAEQIFSVMQRAYRIEADLLDLVDFPPLLRSMTQIMGSDSDFYGFLQNDNLVAVVEVEHLATQHIHIAGLVVDPDFFRQGIGSQLLAEVLELVEWERLTVDTAVANIPAINLYKKSGFVALKQWQTPDNILMITLLRGSSA